MASNNPATSTAHAAQSSSVLRMLARVGFVVLGILHVLIGVIAISIATGGGGGQADQSGAMDTIQDSPAGVLLLWGIVLGLIALAAWQIAEAVIERGANTRTRWGRRAKFVGSAAAYLAIAGTALVYALGGQSESSDSSQSLSAGLLSVPAGVFLLVAVGLGVAAVGIGFVVSGIARSFTKQLRLPTGAARKGIVAFGVAGYVAKGIAVAVTGVLFVVAAITHDPEAAGGLDAALRSLAELPFGAIILWIVGAGLILYGLFCIARARFAKL